MRTKQRKINGVERKKGWSWMIPNVKSVFSSSRSQETDSLLVLDISIHRHTGTQQFHQIEMNIHLSGKYK